MKTIISRILITLVALLMPFVALKANNRPETETRFTDWLKVYIPEQYPGSNYNPHNGWYQVYLPEFDLTVSWGLVPLKEAPLKEVEGLFENKSIFIAKEARKDWAKSSKVEYYPGVGFYLTEYNTASMGNFNVGHVTVVQFDGKPKKFVKQMAKAYSSSTEKSESTFHTWLRDYVKITYPAQHVAYHGAWYQCVIPVLNLTATWGTMSANSMELKALHGLSKDKHIFIEQPKSAGWEKIPNVGFIPGVGYNIPKYDAETMGQFEIGKLTVIQFDGKDASPFVNTMKKEWLVASAKKMTASYTKPRIINTTDLGADPDDEQSMVRQLVCANEFDIEGLIVATGCWKKTQSSTAMLDKIVDAYAKAYPNLRVHAKDYPSPEYLKSISVLGQTAYGMGDVGSGKDSPGSELIIAAVDKDDPRPVWVMGWGGMNNAAQAIWEVRETRTPEELKKFLSKLRLFDILGQDDAGAWIAKNFPQVFYIRATKVYNWQPPKNGEYQKEDIQSHGSLGAAYPDTKWATEGDTPAFMHVYPNGLNDPEQIDQGSWGGRFSFVKQEGIRSMSEVHKIQNDGETQYDPYLMYGNTPDGGNSIKMWEKGYNNDFAARMDWSITSKVEDANHHPIAVLNGDLTRNVLNMKATAGATIELSAMGSIDPDNDSITYTWSFYEEPGSYKGTLNIQNSSVETAKVEIPKDAAGKTIHIILEIHDNGTPNLYAYRRAVITVRDEEKADMPFMRWLYEYIPAKHPNAKMVDHHYWLQGFVNEKLVANWAQINDKNADLKYLEGHNLTQGKPIFIEKAENLDWAEPGTSKMEKPRE